MLRPLAAVAGLALAVAGCGSDAAKKPADPHTVQVKLTDAGCQPSTTNAGAGAATFRATNDDAERVSELYVLDGTKILGEVEHVTPGKSGTLSLTLKAGSYTLRCPGGTDSE